MEILKIAGGLAAIAAVVVLFGMDRGDKEAVATEAPRPVERSFASDDTSARFEPVAKD